MSFMLEAITQLRQFSDQENISSLVNKLGALALPESEEDGLVNSIRSDLLGIAYNTQSQIIISGDLSLKNAAHYTLLALAELHPINDIDPITTDTIPYDKQVVISTGHQFNIEFLIGYFRVQASDLHMNNLEKFFDAGHCTNPLNRQPFSPEDAAHVWKVASSKIQDLSTPLSLLPDEGSFDSDMPQHHSQGPSTPIEPFVMPPSRTSEPYDASYDPFFFFPTTPRASESYGSSPQEENSSARENSMLAQYEQRPHDAPIEALVRKFYSWMTEYNHSAERTDNEALIAWIADLGGKYIVNYQRFCELVNALAEKGYQTNPQPTEAEFDVGMQRFTERERREEQSFGSSRP